MATTINQYDVGDAVRCQGSFTNQSGSAIDPDTVFFQWRDPSGTLTTKEYDTDDEVKRSGTGVYYIDLNINSAGSWHYRWYGVGNDSDNQGSSKHQFRAVGF